jgi:ADP-heptose:LPS heptosyltransferase
MPDINDISQSDALAKFGLTKENLKKLGLENAMDGKYETLKEVTETTDGMVIAKVAQSYTEEVNGNKVPFTKGSSLVLPFGQYIRGKKKKIYKPHRTAFKDLFKRYKGQDLTNKKLLIWRFGGLGDVIVTQSVVKAIKAKYPTCHITYATNPALIESFYSWPFGLVNEAVPFPFSAELLKSHDYHMTFIHSVENCIESTSLNFFDIFKHISGLDYDIDEHMSELIPVSNVVKSLKPHIPPNMILFHMKSSTKLRDMNLYKWKELAEELISKRFFIGIIDAKSKARDVNNYIMKAGLPRDKVLNLATLSIDLNYAIAMASMSKAAITIDSAFAHIMGALRKPAVTICGPYPAHNVVGRYKTVIGVNPPADWNACGKYPCFYNSQESKCPFIIANKTPGCQDDIPNELILEKLNEAIKLC